jgi:hypothetical protein
MSISFSMRAVAAPDVMFRAVGEESVLLNLTSELYWGLDPSGTRMWMVLMDAPSIQAALDTLLTEYEEEAEQQLGQDLQEFLEKLKENGLIEIRPPETASGAAGAASE